MKKLFLPPLITIISCYLFFQFTSRSDAAVAVEMPTYLQVDHAADTVEFDQEETLAALRERIKGMEDRPSGEVYENIQVLKRIPSGRLLNIMEFGYSRSLGVTCTHCHNAKNFASDEKRQKQIARDMMAMVERINNELLGSIEYLESDSPTVNCTTCHRGQVVPALNLDEQ